MFKKGPFKSVKKAIKTSTSNVHTPKLKQSSGPAIDPKIFNLNILAKYGANGTPVCSAFNFVQSLLAVGTDTGIVHVYGQNQVEAVFQIEPSNPIKKMVFVKSIYLVVADTSSNVSVFSLYSKQLLTTFSTVAHITCMESDPSMDWLFIGLEDGSISIHDIDRDSVSYIEIKNHQSDFVTSKSKYSPVVSIQWHPRDIGIFLISYEYVTVTYSLLDREVKQTFFYEVPPEAPGGDYSNVTKKRTPKLIQSLYHPNGLHILTVHEDNSLVFWDAETGHLIQARNSFETDINIPQPGIEAQVPRVSCIHKAFWNCEADPEYTSLLISYNSLTKNIAQSMVLMDFGLTPKYSLNSYEQMSEFYCSPKSQKLIPLEHQHSIVDMLPLPRKSPYFNGCHDPGLFLILLESGQMEALLYPTGLFTQMASLFPYTMSWMRSVVTCSSGYSITADVAKKLLFAGRSPINVLQGGTPQKVNSLPSGYQSILFTGNKNGIVRMSEVARDGLASNNILEINISKLLNKETAVKIKNISFAPQTLELAIAADTGDVALLKFQKNILFQNKDKDLEVRFNRFTLNGAKEGLIDIRDRAPSNVQQGFMPISILHMQKKVVSSLSNSNIGFLAVAYEDGTLIVIDRRGPTIIFKDSVKNISTALSNYITSISFSIMQFGNETYSSILLYCGTDIGEMLSFRVLPGGNGRYIVQPIGGVVVNKTGPINRIGSVARGTNQTCDAGLLSMGKLGEGVLIPGSVIICGYQDVRIMENGSVKGSHYSFKAPVVKSQVCHLPLPGQNGREVIITVFVCLLVDGDIKILSLPDLKELRTLSVSVSSSKLVSQSAIIGNGRLVIRNNVHQAVAISILNTDLTRVTVGDPVSLYNASVRLPSRPQVGAVQWAKGAGACTPEQVDTILAGPSRAPPKYKESSLGIVAAKRPSRVKLEVNHDIPKHLQYNKPVRYTGKGGGYNMVNYVSRAVESQIDAIETSVDDYATYLGKQMDDAMEDTSKDLFRSAMGI
ncbi:hypothetical protein TBLA_0I00900 [Henningerozyma blattae CBS 6284]|uniref:Lethal giant larvae (Lgl)-like C-terminal domain-containing protein n=1 Tax=Henningerozyma blattae (strain ATCC 34711 / CBS 6284 / DSM 70876 / NBRC 10599 / NRRL Y-10934 / UCD 77-7) TaxID=1071380 RepID=I2H8P7_HENB6|nr:hypothetical protein TBLA_0I00900 [Tetrapisispora blattae CBS 6284]CCH62749.1 hypothetical protein TBLA_0I00900 [Tetrapisispora blattae CBS 6284]